MTIKIIAVKRGVEVNFCSNQLEKQYYEIGEKFLNMGRKYQSDFFCYIAVENNWTIGFLYAYIVSKSGKRTYHSTGILDSIIIDQAYQNQGMATLLLETFLDICYNYNIKILKTDIFQKNESMKHLYKKLDMRKYSYQMKLSDREAFL